MVEGRDIGTVVFPEAPVKVYLTADAAERARRRAGDTEAAGQSVQAIERQLRARDHADSTREASPLRPADDAVTIDTTTLTLQRGGASRLGLVAEAGGVGTPGPAGPPQPRGQELQGAGGPPGPVVVQQAGDGPGNGRCSLPPPPPAGRPGARATAAGAGSTPPRW